MRQSELNEYQPSGIACPKGCGEYQNLSIHWGHEHDEPFPDGVKKLANETAQKMSEAQSGRTRSESHRQAISEGQMGREFPPETRQAISEAHEGKSLSKEHREAVSEALTGRTLSESHRQAISEGSKGKSLSEEHKRRMSESHKGKCIPPEQRRKISQTLTGREPGPLSDAHRKAISEGHKGIVPSDEHMRKFRRGQKGTLCNIPTQHTVRSGWESETDLMLYDAGYDFEYEPGPFKIGDGREYTPDFKVGDDIIEVKGYVWDDEDQRAKQFMEAHPEYRYIVIGTELPADEWLPWRKREQLCDLLEDA